MKKVIVGIVGLVIGGIIGYFGPEEIHKRKIRINMKKNIKVMSEVLRKEGDA